mmetsp:Transcript_25731/g.28775  ORF Transcript_25731/g.28775 Transcript_25731/m.28775 type:complete len:363 (+) Transcript_25731:475-1563(+)
MDSMIEMNSLQGRTEDNVCPMEQEHNHDEKPVQWLISSILRPRRNRCLILLVSVLLIITVVYVTDRIFMSRPNMNSLLETSGQDRGDGNNDEEDQQPTLIDEKEVFCEDLSQYQKWYDAKVTKADGVKFRIVKEYKHDENAFTQGLTYHNGKFYESDGLYGKSAVRIVDRDNADATKNVHMANEYFAEGLTYYKDTLVQLTWKSKRGFVYNITSLEEIYNFTFSTERNEGWGITWDRCKDELIVTDGSANIYFWDPQTMKEKRRISIKRLNLRNAKSMNEIEFWRGRILANVWYEDVILVINPQTGVIEKEYDFSDLWPKSERKSKKADVFNGISISADPNVLYVTGKLWDRMFSIELLPDL